MKNTFKIQNEAIKLEINPLWLKTQCTDKHYSFQPIHGEDKLIKVAGIRGYVLSVWYSAKPTKSSSVNILSPGLYIELYTVTGGYHMSPVLINNASDYVHSIAVNTISDKALITFHYQDEKFSIIKKWIYINFGLQVMHKAEWGEDNNTYSLSSFIDDDSFILYERNIFYKYKIHNNDYQITLSPYVGPNFTALTYSNRETGKALYEFQKKWFFVKIDTEGNYLTLPLKLEDADFYKINKEISKNTLVYGYNAHKKTLNIYSKNMKELHYLDYEANNLNEISIHINPTGQISIIEPSKQYALKTILINEKNVTKKKYVHFDSNIDTGVILTSGNTGSIPFNQFFKEKKDLTGFTYGTKPLLLKEVAASHIANLIDYNSFAKLYYIDHEYNSCAGYINNYESYPVVACDAKNIATLYATAAVLSMPFALVSVRCYQVQNDLPPQLYWTGYGQVAEYNKEYNDETAIKYLPGKNGKIKWILPKLVSNCSELECDKLTLQKVYQKIYEEIRLKFHDLIDSAACAIASKECDNNIDHTCSDIHTYFKNSADHLRAVVEGNIIEIGKLLDTENLL
jgi:hypothetical protein